MSPQIAIDERHIVAAIGMDLARDIFALHGINPAGKAILVRTHVSRTMLLDVFASLPPCIRDMEGSNNAHHCEPDLVKLGHTHKMTALRFASTS